MIEEIDWGGLKGAEGADLKRQVFDILQVATEEAQKRPSDDPALLALVPRLAELISLRAELKSFREIHSSLARALGLWNYIDRDTSDASDTIVSEMARVNQLGIALHREQVGALNALLSGQNLILSAPTSFGKSILIDALLLSGRYNRVAIVLPTIALLDEFRRRLVQRFAGIFDVLMHHSEVATQDRVIFLGTQERLINREDLGFLDLAVVDEFYKREERTSVA